MAVWYKLEEQPLLAAPLFTLQDLLDGTTSSHDVAG